MFFIDHLIQVIATLLVFNFNQHFTENKSIHESGNISETDSAQQKVLVAQIAQLQLRVEQLRHEYEKLLPKKNYLIISTSDNEVTLMYKSEVLHRGRCSTGSFVLLKAPDSRQWLFRTPRGQFKVNVKLKDPSWYKPDWAYIEEGKPIPSIYSPTRWQDEVLGKFALGFGPAFMIHGTIYKRFLGLPATHGCVRLDDEDMQIVFHKLTHGCKIFIY